MATTRQKKLKTMHFQRALSACRLPLPFNAEQLQTEAANLAASDWQAHFNNAIYQGDWSAAALRAVPDSHNAIYSDPNADNWMDTQLLERCPHLQATLNQFACPLLSARLLRLAPGAVINEHRDHGLALDVAEVRIHLGIATNTYVEPRIDGNSYQWVEGECWYADFSLPHFFANRGDTERIHLVLDCKVNDWLLALLTTAEQATPNAPTLPPLTVAWLHQHIQSDAQLHRQLFAINTKDDFIATLASVAERSGHNLDEPELKQMMRQNHRAWIERNLP
ncbi:MAG: aspartyl/asparaginyl beta-hydroxylase domain-containing protein [Methylovulum sp.]|nr:aspartyl/asparaginyl beta-hydroxylase domain-containing protein [Methylovulum sp.]